MHHSLNTHINNWGVCAWGTNKECNNWNLLSIIHICAWASSFNRVFNGHTQFSNTIHDRCAQICAHFYYVIYSRYN